MLLWSNAVNAGLNVTIGIASGLLVVTPAGKRLPVCTIATVALQIWPQVLPWLENCCQPQYGLSRLPRLMTSHRSSRLLSMGACSMSATPSLPRFCPLDRSNSFTHGLRQALRSRIVPRALLRQGVLLMNASNAAACATAAAFFTASVLL